MLLAAFDSGRAELFVLYGRRRVGKTELLARACEGRRHVFFVADLDAEPLLRARLSAAVNVTLLGTETASAVYPSWEAVFGVLAHHAAAEPLVVVLDEFTYLVASHPPLASLLQRLWDAQLQHTRLKLVLCGSYIGMMEAAVLGYEAPLYGRHTGQYLLEPLPFHDALPFFAGYDPVDQVRAYGVFGGTPAYLRAIPADRPLSEAIVEQVLSRGTFLYDEVRFLLQEELREPRNYFAILEAIAGGHTRLNEIKQATGLEGISSYVNTLLGLRLIERVVPVTERQPHKSRKGLYRLRDPFFRFWLRFVHPQRTLLEQGGARQAFDLHIGPQLDQFTGPVFERVCEQCLWRAGLAGRLPMIPERIGSWWGANGEIDLVAIGQGTVLAAECKWSTRPVGVDILRRLELRAARSPDLLQPTRYLGLFSRSGFTEDLLAEAGRRNDVILYDLDAIIAG
jgi:AAA+ ATPase superfamily predicted ATPase